MPASTAVLPTDEVVEEGGELKMLRLRCPAGCSLGVAPLGISGLALPAPVTTASVSTERLPPVPPNACRLEIRLRPPPQRAASAPPGLGAQGEHRFEEASAAMAAAATAAHPLTDFDVIGFSLQYEMTFTNVLNMMDLGQILLF